MTTTVVSWNMGYRRKPWQELVHMGADVALLQETCRMPPDVADRVSTGPPKHRDSHVWDSCLWDCDRYRDYFRRRRWPRIAKLSDRVAVEWFKPVFSVVDPLPDDAIRVSDINSIAAAKVTPLTGTEEPFVVISMYAGWISPHPITAGGWKHAMADVSAHRIMSDLSAFIRDTDRVPHRILAAGDLNMDYGGWEDSVANRPLLHARERTVWDRMKALGFEYLGPRHPNGRRADPVPSHLPAATKNVPTFHSAQSSPAAAQVQLDHVFGSRGFHDSIATRAMNGVDEWGSSDHCRLLIEVGN